MTALTPRQERVLAFLRDHFSRCSWGPTRREIAKGAGITSSRALSADLERLRDAGLIRIVPERAAALELVSEPVGPGRRLGDNLRTATSAPGVGAILASLTKAETPCL